MKRSGSDVQILQMYLYGVRPLRAFMRRIKGRSSRRLQQEFPALKKRYWGRHFGARGYFCTTSGTVTDELVLQYLEQHGADATGVSR